MGYYDNYLEHHGVKGQKWGVRRFQNYDGTRIKAAGGKGSKSQTTTKNPNKPKHDFKDNSKSKSLRGETYGMLAYSLAGLGATTFANVSLASIGAISPQLILGEVLSAVGTVAYASLAVSGEINNAKANSKEKKFKEEREQNPVDKKTGFHKKTKEMTPEEDMERVNPGFKNWDQNTKNNCFLCTMSMELRRRGYDVQAQKATEGYDAETLVKDYYKGAKVKQAPGSMTDSEILSEYYRGTAGRISKERQEQMINSTFSEVEKQPKGSRGMLTVVWNGTASGHAMAYANEGGKLVIYDTQANKRYEGDKARDYLKDCSQVNVTRLDNCELNTKYIKEVAV